MAEFEPFTFISKAKSEGTQLFDDFTSFSSGKTIDIDLQLVTALRARHPELIVTTVPTVNVDLLRFAAAGYAFAELDTTTESINRWRGYIPPDERGGSGSLGEVVYFAKYHYRWGIEDFILYRVVEGYLVLQYILKEPRNSETVLSNSSITDGLITAIGAWMSHQEDFVYVFDRYWYRSTELWEQVQKASWDKIILDPKMKKELTAVSEKFFDSKDIYDEYGVPWKRGLIFYGPPGNGKTISIKALMHALYSRKKAIPTLYVKSAPATFHIHDVFVFARQKAPCLLVIEDIDTIVTPDTRAYFFNEVDGLEDNNGILMLASTNHLDKLDPGLAKRPSRFDRKYLFPLPSEAEREAYCQLWQEKIKDKPVDFPSRLCPAIAHITYDFSFAFLQELFVSSLLVIARGDSEGSDGLLSGCDKDNGLDDYELWRVIKQQVKILRDDMDSSEPKQHIRLHDAAGDRFAPGKVVPLPTSATGAFHDVGKAEGLGAREYARLDSKLDGSFFNRSLVFSRSLTPEARTPQKM